MIREQHSRLPVYEGKPEKIIGILHYKDLLPVWEERRQRDSLGTAEPRFPYHPAAAPHMVVPETKPLSQMLEEFRKGRSHMAMVVDEFGTIVGMLTVEDVLEQIVGRIEDEHDEKIAAGGRRGRDRNWTAPPAFATWKANMASRSPATANSKPWRDSCCSRLGAIPHAGESVDIRAGATPCWRWTTTGSRACASRKSQPERLQGRMARYHAGI